MSVGAAQPDAQPPASRERAPRRRRLWLLWLPVLVALLGIATYFLRYDLRSYAVLTHIIEPQASNLLLSLESHDVTVEAVTIPVVSRAVPLFQPSDLFLESNTPSSEAVVISVPGGSLKARLYMPVGVAHPRGMVVVHGVHYLGIDEPRLVAFARAMAGSGLAILTPQVDSLADYRVDMASIATIGESAVWLNDRLGNRVTVTGISFAGSLSLLAATNRRYASHMGALVLIGPYDDLARVSRFVATNQEVFPDGHSISFAAHDYGASVFVYAHLPQFFPAADLRVAHEALRAWLAEDPEQARAWMDRLSAPSRPMMQALVDDRIEAIRPQILAAIAAEGPELAAMSPHGHLADLRVPVFILHGSADNVIPPSESLWLAQDIPKQELRALLITNVFSHVDANKGASWYDDIRLVRFLGAVLRAAD